MNCFKSKIGSNIGTLLLAAAAMLPSVTRADATVCAHQVVDLIAGQHFDVGDVAVNVTADGILHIDWATDPSWVVTKTHLDVGTSLDEIPQNRKDNPIPGRFRYSSSYNPPSSSHQYSINLFDLGFQANDDLFVAFHLETSKLDLDGFTVQQETAWMDGVNFDGSNWATYLILSQPLSCSNDTGGDNGGGDEGGDDEGGDEGGDQGGGNQEG